MTETFLLDQNIENDFRDFLSKMIFTPFINIYGKNFRFSTFTKDLTEEYLKDKRIDQFQKLGNMMGAGILVKRTEKQQYKLFDFNDMRVNNTNCLHQRGGAWYINNNNEKASYYLAVADNLFYDNSYIDNCETYNTYVNLLHNILSDSERKELHKNYLNSTKLIRKQLENGIYDVYSTISNINTKIIHPIREPEDLFLDLH